MKIFYLILIFFLSKNVSADTIPNLIGEWNGKNNTYSELKGLKTWEKKINITQQNDRRSKGILTNQMGRKIFNELFNPENLLTNGVDPITRGNIFAKILKKKKLRDG